MRLWDQETGALGVTFMYLLKVMKAETMTAEAPGPEAVELENVQIKPKGAEVTGLEAVGLRLGTGVQRIRGNEGQAHRSGGHRTRGHGS